MIAAPAMISSAPEKYAQPSRPGIEGGHAGARPGTKSL
jgi:hypothetical protein